MGFQYRRSKKIGDNTRVNVSTRSVGVSTGTRNMRVSVNSRGGVGYSFRIPGTNIRFRKYSRKSGSAATGLLIMCVVYICQFIAWLIILTPFLVWYVIKYTFLGLFWIYKKIFQAIKNIFMRLKNHSTTAKRDEDI